MTEFKRNSQILNKIFDGNSLRVDVVNTQNEENDYLRSVQILNKVLVGDTLRVSVEDTGALLPSFIITDNAGLVLTSAGGFCLV